jgi:hypothetical protein
MSGLLSLGFTSIKPSYTAHIRMRLRWKAIDKPIKR